MDRIADQFARAREENRTCFVAYIAAGDPDFETCVEISRTLVESGVDILELGVPFSDPLADGLTNQLAAQRALAAGMRGDRVFDLVREIRKFTEIPIIFYTYYNLVFSNGVENYVRKAREAGVDGMLTLDLPPEEAGEVLEVSRKHGLKNIFIVAPTTPPERLRIIGEAASGFIYYVSREGVTGVREELPENLAGAVSEIKKWIDLPVVVGFGISTREQVRQVAAVCDAPVVGSALVNCVKENLGDRDRILASIRARAEDLAAGVYG